MSERDGEGVRVRGFDWDWDWDDAGERDPWVRVRIVDGVEESVVDEEFEDSGRPDVGLEAVNPR